MSYKYKKKCRKSLFKSIEFEREASKYEKSKVKLEIHISGGVLLLLALWSMRLLFKLLN